MCLAAIGSQTGGSITRPAAYCGVCGLKPTFGRVSRAGMVPVSFHLDHPGPLSRCVSDLAVVLGAIAGADAADPFCSDKPVSDYLAALPQIAPPRLGLLEGFFVERADASVRGVFDEALGKLRDRGGAVQTVELPADFEEFLPMHRRVMAVEAAEFHCELFERFPDQYGPHIRRLLEEGLSTSAPRYAAALRHRVEFGLRMRGLLADCNALLTPAAPNTAPATLETTGDPSFNSPWSYTGMPTVSLPCGLASNGMPVALQLVGRPWEEAELLAAAAWCEAALGFAELPPLCG
jgi:aspartyl-tRNA(Asn)/glutamyl-tRNA(Gln) amidotransferase subunit A